MSTYDTINESLMVKLNVVVPAVIYESNLTTSASPVDWADDEWSVSAWTKQADGGLPVSADGWKVGQATGAYGAVTSATNSRRTDATTGCSAESSNCTAGYKEVRSDSWTDGFGGTASNHGYPATTSWDGEAKVDSYAIGIKQLWQ